jgi:hypothetical protein
MRRYACDRGIVRVSDDPFTGVSLTPTPTPEGVDFLTPEILPEGDPQRSGSSAAKVAVAADPRGARNLPAQRWTPTAIRLSACLAHFHGRCQ